MAICWLRVGYSRARGLGHLMRSSALGEAAEADGRTPVVVADGEEGVALPLPATGWRWIQGGDGAWSQEVSVGDLVVVDGVDDATVEVARASEHGAVVVLVDEEDRAAPPGTALRVAPDWDEAQAAGRRGPPVLAGPRHALVREDVRARRRRRALDGVHLGVVLGGTDVAGLNSTVVRTALADGWVERVTAVVGQADQVDPALEAVERVRVEVAPPSLPAVLDDVDLVVSGAGNTAWEMCCMGLPLVVAALVPDQERPARLLEEAGAARALGPADRVVEGLPATLASLADPDDRRRLATAGLALVDGGGAERVLAAVGQLETVASGGRP